MTSHQSSTQQKAIVSFVVLCVMAILIVGVQVTKKDPQAATTTPQSQATPAASTTNSMYKDGVYMAIGTYNSPGGKQSLAVNLTIAGNSVSDASVTPSADSGVAQVYQNYFVQNYKSYVIGKNVNSLKLSRVSGSSLTSQGFNDALAQIKMKAAM